MMKIEEAILYVLAERNGGLHGMPAEMPPLLRGLGNDDRLFISCNDGFRPVSFYVEVME